VAAAPVWESVQVPATVSHTEAAEKLYEQGTKEALISAIAKIDYFYSTSHEF
jgi:hypothetical protein